MIRSPKISIVTPSYNQGKYLERTILSVLDQKYPNLEYVVIDGGSSDESVEIIKKYKSRLSYWVSEKDKGQAEAINKGFEKTSGEIITWLNSDDVLMPGSLNLVANIFTRLREVDWISGIPTVISDEGLIIYRGYRPTFIRKFIELGFYHGTCLGFIMQEGTFWRRSLWEKVGAKVESKKYSFDFRLWQELAKYSSLTAVHTSLGAFRFNPRRKTKKINKYYEEIEVFYPKLMRIFLLPARFFVHFLLRYARLSGKVFYKDKESGWFYYSTGFLRFPWWFSRQKIKIKNPLLA